MDRQVDRFQDVTWQRSSVAQMREAANQKLPSAVRSSSRPPGKPKQAKVKSFAPPGYSACTKPVAAN